MGTLPQKGYIREEWQDEGFNEWWELRKLEN